MTWVNKGIQFAKGTGTGSFNATYISDVGISLKDTAGCVGIEVGDGCKPYSSFAKATVYMTQDCTGVKLKQSSNPQVNPTGINQGLWNLNVSKVSGNRAGTGVYLEDPTNILNNQDIYDYANQNMIRGFFIATSNLSHAVHNDATGNNDQDASGDGNCNVTFKYL